MKEIKKIKSLDDLYRKAGSKAAIAVYLKCSEHTVWTWKNTGIPKKYWIDLMDKFGVTREELEFINRGIPDAQ